MPNLKKPTFRIRKIIAILLFFILISYLIYNIISGDRGILSLFKLTEQHKILQDEVSILEEEKRILQSKVNRMKPESLDLDLLEEQARKNLGYAQKNETIYVD
jgi:cell division protein FtsB